MTIEGENEKPTLGTIIRVILLSSLITILPGTAIALFGWAHMLLPLLAFYVLSKYGEYTGKKLLICSGILSSIVLSLLQSFDLLLFSLILLIAGYVLFVSYKRADNPAMSGLKTSITISAGWICTLLFFTITTDTSPYSQLIFSLNEGITEAIAYYRQSESVTSETRLMVEETLQQMKVILPLIMPAILGSFILFITWFTMVIGNNFIIRQHGSSSWRGYDYWQLPEKMIWTVIALGIAAILPFQLLKIGGINGLILVSIIYCFQGLAIAVFFMNKWKVPLLLRSFFYVMMIIQSLGTIILLILGISDIWFDYRKLRQPAVSE